MKIFDTHAHYDDERFDEDREKLLSAIYKNGVKHFVNVASSVESIDSTLALASGHPECYVALGIHPSDIDGLNEKIMGMIKEKIESFDRCVAVGEIGLDYYWGEENVRESQKKWFIRQLDLAREVKLPVIIHSRDAAEDTFRIMKESHAEEIGGVVHCFSYSKEMAREYVKMGFFIGIGGVVTFKNARKLVEVVEDIPLESLVLETDCPYLTPTPYRGERNSSAYLPLVAEKIAEIKGISVDEVYDVTYKNALKLYRLKEDA